MDKGKSSRGGMTPDTTGTAGPAAASIGTQPSRAGGERYGDTTVGATGSAGSRSKTGGEEDGGVVDQVKARASKELSSQKGRATGEIDAVAQAVRDASHRLRDEQHETMAVYVERAAGQLERLSRTIREKDLNELLHDAQRLARREPAWFIGGSFALGLLAARFLKSSKRDGEDDPYWPEGSRGAWTEPGWGPEPAAEDYRSYPRRAY
jgi:hypothetical protein